MVIVINQKWKSVKQITWKFSKTNKHYETLQKITKTKMATNLHSTILHQRIWWNRQRMQGCNQKKESLTAGPKKLVYIKYDW